MKKLLSLSACLIALSACTIPGTFVHEPIPRPDAIKVLSELNSEPGNTCFFTSETVTNDANKTWPYDALIIGYYANDTTRNSLILRHKLFLDSEFHCQLSRDLEDERRHYLTYALETLGASHR